MKEKNDDSLNLCRSNLQFEFRNVERFFKVGRCSNIDTKQLFLRRVDQQLFACIYVALTYSLENLRKTVVLFYLYILENCFIACGFTLKLHKLIFALCNMQRADTRFFALFCINTEHKYRFLGILVHPLVTIQLQALTFKVRINTNKD